MTIRFPEKKTSENLVLLACGIALCIAYLHRPLFHLNSVLAGGVGDSLKNYFTFAFHARYWTNPLDFTGFNYPFGEHIVYADCQPLFSVVLRFLPFAHSYLIAIHNGLVMLSFIVTPMLVYRLFALQGFRGWPAAAIAAGVAILCPQYYKITAGHYALAYSCVIPLGMLLTLRCMLLKGSSLWVALYNLLLFLVHPYLGFGMSAFSFLALLVYLWIDGSWKHPNRLLAPFFAGLLPLILFVAFMKLTDDHLDRPAQPFGIDLYTANAGSLLLSYTGPFTGFIRYITGAPAPSYEAYAYLGFAMIVIACASLIGIPFVRRKPLPDHAALAVITAALLLLIFSFGPYSIFNRLTGIRVNAIEQLRAPGRFAWFFYYALPVALFPYLSAVFGPRVRKKGILTLIAIAFLSLNLWEANFLVTPDEHVWGKPNIFDRAYLSDAERSAMNLMKKSGVKAIIAVPMLFSGTDVFQRDDPEAGMTAPVMYSFHTGIPLMSSNLTRTSLSETAASINALGGFGTISCSGSDTFVVLHFKGRTKPDERRLLKASQPFFSTPGYELRWLTARGLNSSRERVHAIAISRDTIARDFLYLSRDAQKAAFDHANMSDIQALAHIDANRLEPDTYVVSIHFHYPEKTWDGLNCNLFVAKNHDGRSDWNYNFAMRAASYITDEYVVVEDEFVLEPNASYDLLMKGNATLSYSVSDVMLRRSNTNVSLVRNGIRYKNNFPVGPVDHEKNP